MAMSSEVGSTRRLHPEETHQTLALEICIPPANVRSFGKARPVLIAMSSDGRHRANANRRIVRSGAAYRLSQTVRMHDWSVEGRCSLIHHLDTSRWALCLDQAYSPDTKKSSFAITPSRHREPVFRHMRPQCVRTVR